MDTPNISPERLPEMEVAHVLFMDVVGYSQLPIEQQVAITGELKQLVAATPEYRSGNEQKTLICMPTGDGMALAFFSGPEPPVNCAIRIANSLKDHPRIKLRMGINSGPVYRIPDIKGEMNVAGGGVNFAQRVMDCGDEGHILLSASIADVLRQHGHWAPLIKPLGIAEVKHGEHVSVFNLCGESVGNPEVPQKLLGKLSIPEVRRTPAPEATPSSTPRPQPTPRPQTPPPQPDVTANIGESTITSAPQPRRLGDYEIVRELGHGGMGQVYLVRNVISDRLEAMKILLPDLAEQRDLEARFMREIKLLATLEHPNIAQLRTAFSADDQLIMIMEYVEGDTLAHRLERGPFSVADALNYIGQVLNALTYAHGKGIVHRDIKPANMMLTPNGVVKLMDFGIARSNRDVTATGVTLGSLDYMSPEQVKAEPTDARSDLYSVGVSLYEMVTGQRLFNSTSSYSIMEAQVKQIPRAPIELQPSLPAALNDIIMIAIAKEPGKRFQSAEAFRNALGGVSVSAAAAAAAGPPAAAITPLPPPIALTPPPAAFTPTPAAYTPLPQPVRASRHVGWIIAAAIVVLVAVFGGTQVFRSRSQNQAITPAVQPTTPQPAANPSPQPAAQPPAAAAAATPPAPAPHPRHTQDNMQPAPPVNTGPTPEELAEQKRLMDELENENDHLDSRAAVVESSLSALEQQQRASGFGLRGDMVEARSNMRADLAKAKQALDNSDTERARKYLDQGAREVEKLEAFLGRR
jgi:eukaryotic-like serine/threonine-protein kinase